MKIHINLVSLAHNMDTLNGGVAWHMKAEFELPFSKWKVLVNCYMSWWNILIFKLNLSSHQNASNLDNELSCLGKGSEKCIILQAWTNCALDADRVYSGKHNIWCSPDFMFANITSKKLSVKLVKNKKKSYGEFKTSSTLTCV